jgi:uncharacterized oligopeptide transporter (OPT) family protein
VPHAEPERSSPAELPPPYVPPSATLPELTIKAALLAIVLSVVLGAANAYMGLFAGMTVSASIPAAVISMAVLRFFRRRSILENNIVQTGASAGESLAAGVIFTFPALVLMGYWSGFDYWKTTLIAAIGGVLGVLFTIPLRRLLITGERLTFPEGVATAEVLKTGEEGGRGVLYLLVGGVVGAGFKLCQAGFHLWSEVLQGALRAGRTILYGGTNLSPALMGVGYIVGLNIATLVFLGGALNWLVAIPIRAAGMDWPVWEPAGAAVQGAGPAWARFTVDLAQDPGAAALVGQPVDALGWAARLWSSQTRYIGVGAMVIGGLWALVSLAGPIVRSVRQGLRAYTAPSDFAPREEVLRTERDTPTRWVVTGIAALIVPIFFLYLSLVRNVPVTAFMTVVMVVAGFLFSAVAGYMAGLVGSSNNPISGVTIATILTSALLLVLFLRPSSSERWSAAPRPSRGTTSRTSSPATCSARPPSSSRPSRSWGRSPAPS